MNLALKGLMAWGLCHKISGHSTFCSISSKLLHVLINIFSDKKTVDVVFISKNSYSKFLINLNSMESSQREYFPKCFHKSHINLPTKFQRGIKNLKGVNAPSSMFYRVLNTPLNFSSSEHLQHMGQSIQEWTK